MRGHPATLTIGGETRSVATWARISGLCYNTLYYRLRKGVDPATAVFSGRYSTDLKREGGDAALPVYKPKPKRRPPVRFPVGTLLRWGSVQSVTFRSAA